MHQPAQALTRAARRLATPIFAIPVIGYALRIVVGVLKLPRLNMHLRRVEAMVLQLEAMRFLPQPAERDGRPAPASAQDFHQRLVALEEAWRQNIPAFLNAVATVSAFGHELARAQQRLPGHGQSAGPAGARLAALAGQMEQVETRLDNSDKSTRAIWERIEFVRREVLFELAHGTARAAQPAEPAPAEAQIRAPGKVAEAREKGALRLNLGCGHIAVPDYINIDMRDLPGVDVVSEVDNLPFERGSVDEIFSAHLVEHFPQEAMRRTLLPYWRDMLRPGGIFRAITPDAAAMLAGAGAGTYAFDDFREVVFGAQDYAGDYHYNLFTPNSFAQLLEEAGFTDIEVPVAARRNGKCFEFEITARRS